MCRYNVAALSESVVETVRALIDQPTQHVLQPLEEPEEAVQAAIQDVKALHSL